MKGFWGVVTKRPKVRGSEKMGGEVLCEVQWSGVKWCDVIILGEMSVLSLIYSYVAVCMFCAVRCVVIICCYLLFYLQLCSCMYVLCSTFVSLLFASLCYFIITGRMFYNIFCVCYLFCIFVPVLCMLWLCFIFVFFLYCFFCSAVSFLLLSKCTDCCHQVETQLE